MSSTERENMNPAREALSAAVNRAIAEGAPVYVNLTPEQAARHEAAAARWLQVLRAQAADSSDPETQSNARALLAARGDV